MLREQERFPINKLTGASLWIHQDVSRVTACIWNLLSLFHPKLHGRLSLIYGSSVLVRQHESAAAGVNRKVFAR